MTGHLHYLCACVRAYVRGRMCCKFVRVCRPADQPSCHLFIELTRAIVSVTVELVQGGAFAEVAAIFV